jgi:hypothetical protein
MIAGTMEVAVIEILATKENIEHGTFSVARREITLMLGLMRPAQPSAASRKIALLPLSGR